MSIHPTAVISNKAKLGKGVSIGPYSVIGDGVNIADNVKIANSCTITGNTSIGANCNIFSGAVIGSVPQDLKYKGENSFLVIGKDNTIREFCTFNPGTSEGSKTIIGDGNLFMAYTHVAHDCVVGNNCIIANVGTLAGHVTIEDGAVIGGIVAIHQFVRVGTLSIIGGCSKVVQDIPPFSTCDGHPARVYGLNLIGLRRKQIPRQSITCLNSAFNILFTRGISIKHALEEIEKAKLSENQEVGYLVNFIKNSKRGLSRSCRSPKEE
ncbi:MAG: acyl-ACP--UDP-N-acetylglucosamine O-acyltransferase [Candidatus Omnitrophota bacterium]|jgi:UDP-N-acetylglucosamine acyltransferase|nr:MAG: acyl-ACP--UDP-N-acetylglucosamine O-acyltransferase [Candidatus Omnitrophota bacterium]